MTFDSRLFCGFAKPCPEKVVSYFIPFIKKLKSNFKRTSIYLSYFFLLSKDMISTGFMSSYIDRLKPKVSSIWLFVRW
jgi:hypothetical protein